MGDTGALFLGYSFAVISVQGVFKLHAVISFVAPLMVFAFPLLDTLFAIVRRLVAGKSPFAPDRGHLHHRLVDMGFTQKESVNILYAICGILGLVAVFCTESMFEHGGVIRSVCVAILAMVIFFVNFLVMKNPNTRKPRNSPLPCRRRNKKPLSAIMKQYSRSRKDANRGIRSRNGRSRS